MCALLSLLGYTCYSYDETYTQVLKAGKTALVSFN